MNVLFRCDGNGAIGAGHLVRCSALAREITRRGGRAALVCRPVAANLSWAVAGATVLCVAPGRSDDAAGGGGLDERDLAAFLEHARCWRADWLCVDQYGADGSYLEAIGGAGYHLAVLDDGGVRDLSAADLLINQNLGAESIPYRVKRAAAVCLGTAFAALRPEFRAARARLEAGRPGGDPRQRVKQVFVGFGGSRLAGYGTQVAEAIASSGKPLAVALAEGMNAAAVAGAMSDSGLAISAAGSTVWELCCLGVPAVVWPLADNQRPIAEALDAVGAAVAVGGIGEALAAANELMNSPCRRRALARTARGLVDGLGAERVAGEMAKRVGGRRSAKVPVRASD